MPGSTRSRVEQAARVLAVLDLAGVFVFALEGALAAMAAGLDLLCLRWLSRAQAGALRRVVAGGGARGHRLGTDNLTPEGAQR